MIVTKTAGALLRSATVVTSSLIRHPVGSVAAAAGFAKGVTGASVGLLHDLATGHRGHRSGTTTAGTSSAATDTSPSTAATASETASRAQAQGAAVAEAAADRVRESLADAADEAADAAQSVADAADSVAEKGAEEAAGTGAGARAEVEESDDAPEPDPRDDLPGPDIVGRAVPEIDELPEPIVIEADDDAGVGESFHTEPKAASRASEHEGLVGDREEAEDYAEEAELPDTPAVDIETPVGTTGADVADNPATAESDLQQPGTPPLFDEAAAKAVTSESEVLQRGAESARE